MPQKKYTPEEIEYLMLHFPHENTQVVADQLGRSYSSVAGKASALGLKKSEAFKSDSNKTGHINLLRTGAGNRYEKGHVPMNKGRRQTDYMTPEAIARTAATRFQKGRLPHNTLEDGAISIRNSKGFAYQWIRVRLGVWKLLHRVVWEREKGSIPKGYNVQFKDGNTLNCALDNLELVKRGENMRRNTIHRYPPELKTAIRRLGKLKKATNNAT